MEGNKILGIEADLTFVGSWFSINRKHTYHEMHNHIPATWSGVYYVQAKEDDAPITFYDPKQDNKLVLGRIQRSKSYNTPSIV